MKVLEAKFVEGFIRMANDGWEQGWHERNGGNLSYRIKPEEVESVKEEFTLGEWKEIGTYNSQLFPKVATSATSSSFTFGGNLFSCTYSI